MKKCIFHMPQMIDETSKSGSSVHPINMIQGFRDIGFEVVCVIGYGQERKKRILEIKERIMNGEKFDFLFSESSSMPTLLTEKNHFPKYPFLDFSFMKFCKKHNVKIGIFCADIFWKFDVYKQGVPFLKRCISIPMYKYDIHMFKKIANHIFLPSKRMLEYIPEFDEIKTKINVLYPGCNHSTISKDLCMKIKDESLKIFYVGGISGTYDLYVLLKVIKNFPQVKLTICCRANEWESSKMYYRDVLTPSITIVHVFGDELVKYYNEADICSCFIQNNEYMSMAMPVKIFEYLSFELPIIGVKDTVSGDFIEENKIGWSIHYNEHELTDLLMRLLSDKEEINKVKMCEKQIIKGHTWTQRARFVTERLELDGVKSQKDKGD